MAQNRLVGRLRVYEPNGPLIGSLPHPISWEMSIPLNDMPSLTIVYPKDSPSIELLSDPCEVAVEIRNPVTGVYSEEPGCRFLNIRRQHDMIQRPGVVTYVMPSYGWMLKKARFTNRSLTNKDNRRVFADATPGTGLSALIEEAKSRGNLTGLDYNFSPTADSSNAAWDFTFDAEYEYGQDAWSILDSLTTQGLADWRMDGRTLEVYNADETLRRNLALDSGGVILHPTASHLEEPADRTLEDWAQTMIVQGDKGMSVVVESFLEPIPWGNWEDIMQAGGVFSPGSLMSLGSRVLNSKLSPRLMLTKQVDWRDGSPTPLIDYRPGDVIRGRTENGNQLEPLRVYQISMATTEPYGIVTHLVLNDRFLERQMKNERWVNRVSGQGGPGTGGGTGTNPIPVPQPDPENNEPAVPTGLVVTSTGYFNEVGDPVGRAKLEFDPVFDDIDGNDVTVSRYVFYARPADIANDLTNNASVRHPLNATPGNKLTGYLSNLDSGRQYMFAVQAIGLAGKAGEFTSEVALTIAYPTDPMPKPSDPILSTKLATVKVEWDGDDDTGVPMPLRFRALQVEMSLNGTTGWSRVGEIFEAGSAVIVTGQDAQLTWSIGDTLYFRTIALDTANNFSSAYSDVASIVVQGVEGPDIEANSITANNIAAGTITAEKIAAYSLTVDRLSVGESNNLIADPGFVNADLYAHRRARGNANTSTGITWGTTPTGNAAVATKSSGTGTLAARLPLSNNVIFLANPAFTETVDVGQITQFARPTSQTIGGLMGRFNVAISGPAFPGGTSLSVGMVVKCFDRTGTQLTNTQFASKNYTATGANEPIQSIAPGFQVPANTVAIYLYIFSQWINVPNGTTLSISGASAWQENSVYIGDGMIQAPLLAADCVTTTQLKSDAVTVKHVMTGPILQTSLPSSGLPRVEVSPNANFLNQAGIRLDTIGPGARDTVIYVADGAGTGGWTPYSFVINGPEVTRNSSGRVDFNMQVGGGMYFKKAFVDSNGLFAGVESPTATNELGLYGTMARGATIGYLLTCFRSIGVLTTAGQRNGSVTWGADNGWGYRPVISPNATSTTVAMYANVYTFSATGFSWRCSADMDGIQVFAWRGSYDI